MLQIKLGIVEFTLWVQMLTLSQLGNQESAKRSAEDEEQDEGKADEEGANRRTLPSLIRVP
jgi:hypothetical protein